jgi:hypothetical protein
MHKTLLLLLAASTAGCALSDDSLDTTSVESEENVWQWTADTPIAAQTTSYQPGLAPFGTQLYMAYRGNDDTKLYTTKFNGTGWSGASEVPGQLADYGPALAPFNRRLTMTYHVHGQNRLVMTQSTDGASWSTPVTAGTSIGTATIRNAPATAVFGLQLYTAYCTELTNGYRRLHLDRFDGFTWSSVADYAADPWFDCQHVALGVLPNGKLDIIFTASYTAACSSDCWRMYEVTGSGAPTAAWTPVRMSMRSKKPPTIVTCGTTAHLVHAGYSTPEEMWWSFRDGTGWSDDVRMPSKFTEGGGALGCYQGTRGILAHGTLNNAVLNRQILWSEYGP